jgi:hypothetical protein
VKDTLEWNPVGRLRPGGEPQEGRTSEGWAIAAKLTNPEGEKTQESYVLGFSLNN